MQARKSGPALASRAIDAVLAGPDHPLAYPGGEAAPAYQATVSDGEDSASQTFDVIVSGPNNAPTITSVPDQTVSASAGSFSLAIDAS